MQAILFLDAWATGRIALGYTDVDAATLEREMPLLTADEESYAAAIVAFLTLLRKAKGGDELGHFVFPGRRKRARNP